MRRGNDGPGGALRRPLGVRFSRRSRAGAWLVAVLALPAAALTPGEHLDRFDANGDGRVDRGEFQAYLIDGFDARDHNRNGILDIDEQPPGRSRKPLLRQQQLRAYGEQFERQDSNRDGHLDLLELLAPPR